MNKDEQTIFNNFEDMASASRQELIKDKNDSNISYFSTTDFPLACFLKMTGIDLREIQLVEDKGNRCKFVFRVESHSDKINSLLREWNTSPKCRDLKKMLYVSKNLRYDLKNFLKEHGRSNSV